MSRRRYCALAGLCVVLLVSGCGPSLALHQAIEKGQTEEALALVAEGKCLKEATPEGYTPLHYAARHGNGEVAKALLDAGLEIDWPCDKQGYKPLYLAAVGGHVAVARLLLDKGADVESKTARGESALLIAAQNGHVALAELLIEHGANVNHQADNSMSPLAVAARFGHLSTVRLLLEKGADPNVRETNGVTPLLEAAMHRKTNVVTLLVEKGANVRVASSEGITPLMVSARAGDLESVKLLLEKGSDLEAQVSTISMSALHYAALGDHAEIVDYLLTAGAKLYTIEEGAGTYSTAVISKWYGHRCEAGGSLEEAVQQYTRAGQYYDKAVGYFENEAAETGKRIDKIHFGNFMRQLAGAMAAGAAASGGGYGYASYRVYDASYLEQQKKAHLDKAAQCRQWADTCRKLADCYAEHGSDSQERQGRARILKDQLGLP